MKETTFENEFGYSDTEEAEFAQIYRLVSGPTPKLSSPLLLGWFHMSAKGQ